MKNRLITKETQSILIIQQKCFVELKLDDIVKIVEIHSNRNTSM